MKFLFITLLMLPMTGHAFEMFCPVEEYASDPTLNNIEDAISCGQDLNEQDELGNTALHNAIYISDYRAIARLLSARGIDLNIQNKNGDSPLMVAVFRDDVGAVSMLLGARGIDVNLESNRQFETALMVAASRGKVTMTYLLMNAPGIDINYLNLRGMSAIMLAAKYNKLNAIKVIMENARGRLDSSHIALARRLATHATVIAALE